MTKREFIEHYEIKDALPVDPSRKVIPADALYSALCDFLSERFKGAIRTEIEPTTAQSVLISAEYMAFFFKTLLTDVYGRVLLTIRSEADEKHFHIIISSEEDLPLTERELQDLIRLARGSGMEIYPDARSLRLSASFSPAAIRRVYAITIVDGRRIIFGKLNEIFCCGELLSEDATTCLLTESTRQDKERKKVSKKK